MIWILLVSCKNFVINDNAYSRKKFFNIHLVAV